jgi:hypothetical protein
MTFRCHTPSTNGCRACGGPRARDGDFGHWIGSDPIDIVRQEVCPHG